MTFHQGDQGERFLSCDADRCPRTRRLGTRDYFLSGFPPILSRRVGWQTVGERADNVHRCPDHRTDT